MADVILGLLLIRPMSQYDLLKAFSAGISLFYQASPGSIRRALTLLEKAGHIVREPSSEGGRGRVAYSPTDAGRARFRTWMLEPLPTRNVETPALSRLYFLGMLEASEREQVLAHIETAVEAAHQELVDLQSHVENQPIPDELSHLAPYGRATLDYGVAAHRMALDWFRDLRTRLP